ncbi:unnamed protein product [Rhizoctonia solani]|uniref:DUF6535 domain-containing protein n=1 Tax=Rhizoctonia solani TaxID=456999 RepID=A0A8H3AYH2_9AGAM|nr:unnamed protein product [Rhizoctonia solani]
MSDQQVKDDGKPKPSETTQAEFGEARGAFYQQSNHDKLASDRYGEELDPEACIWRMYAEEAKEQDAESVREKNENLNNLLLFATLFSAIVTTFIIDSTSLLQQDSSEVSIQLLLALVQSQRRIEAGTPDLAPFPIEIPTFEPSSIARLINVLWFVSLMISLGAAVVAILAKEWLTAFLAYKTRHAQKYALERQVRLANQRTWNMLPIIDLLPTLLNFALVLFGVGLIIRLWTLDFVVAGVTSVISVGVGGIYLLLVALGALLKACPYKSQISRYSRKLIPKVMLDYFKDASAAQDTSDDGSVKRKSLHLLGWLFHNSRDPVLSSYVTQALAGLKSRGPGLETSSNDPGSKEASNHFPSYTKSNLDIYLLFEMGAQAVDQLEALPTKGGDELTLNGGSSAARLAIALSEIYPSALNWKTFKFEGTALEAPQARQHLSTQTGSFPQEIVADDISILARRITDKARNALNLFWVETSPALTPIAYAYLATAELKMLRHDLAIASLLKAGELANLNHRAINIPPPNLDQDVDATVAPVTATTPGNATTTVTAREGTDVPVATDEGVSELIDGLWERYTRALARTALVIKSALYHADIYQSQELQSAISELLLEARVTIKQVKRYDVDLSAKSTISHWNKDISIRFTNTVQRVSYRCEVGNFEVLESLVDFCRSYNVTDSVRLEGFQVAAFEFLVTFWADYFWDGVSKNSPNNTAALPSWITELNQNVPQTPPYDLQTSADIINQQCVLLTHIAYTLERRNVTWAGTSPLPPSQNNVVELILDLVTSRFGALVNTKKRFQYDRNENDPRRYEWTEKMEVEGWVGCATDNLELNLANYSTDRAWRNHVHQLCWHTLRLLVLAGTLNSHLMDVALENLALITVLDFIYGALRAPSRDVTILAIGDFLYNVASRIKFKQLNERETEYFKRGRGFYILAKVGQVESDRAAVAECVKRILDTFYWEKISVDQRVFLSLLEAASYVWDPVVKVESYALIAPSIYFQLENLSHPISYFVTETPSSLQTLLNGLKNWAEHKPIPDSAEHFTYMYLPPPDSAILYSLVEQVQRHIESGQPCWGSFVEDIQRAKYYEPNYKRFPPDQEPQKSIIDPAKGFSDTTAPGTGNQAQSTSATCHAASPSGAPNDTETSGVVGKVSGLPPVDTHAEDGTNQGFSDPGAGGGSATVDARI